MIFKVEYNTDHQVDIFFKFCKMLSWKSETYLQKCNASNGDFHPFSYFYSESSLCACPNQNLKSTHEIYNSHILPSLRSYQLPHQTPFYFYSFHFLGRLWRTVVRLLWPDPWGWYSNSQFTYPTFCGRSKIYI